MTERELTPETQVVIRAAVERITAEHGLLAETQEELAAHLEDKTLAYVSGKQPLTEADALLLARHHLGDAKVLGKQLARAALRRRFIPIPVLQRLVIASTALFVAVGIARISYSFVYFPSLVVGPFHRALELKDSFYTGTLIEAEIATLLTMVFVFPFLLFALARAMPQVKSGRTSLLIAVAAFSFAVFTASLPGQYSDATIYFGNPTMDWTYPPAALHTLHLFAWMLLPLVMLLEWIRYTCQKLFTWRTVGLAFIVWFLATNLTQVIQHVMTKFEEYSMTARDQSLQQYIALNTLQMSGAVAGYSAAAQVPLVVLILCLARAVRAYRDRGSRAMPEAS